MSSEVITKNDLSGILNNVMLRNPATENGIIKGGINLDVNDDPENLWINWQGDRLTPNSPIYNLGTTLSNGRRNLNVSTDNGETWTGTGHYYMPFDKIYPVGSVYTTGEATSPTNLGVPGTWTLIDKELSYRWITSGITWNTTNTQATYNFVAIESGHTIELRFRWNTKIAPSDTDITVATLTPATLGVTNFHDMYGVGLADGLNAAVLCYLDSDNNYLRVWDFVTRATSYPTGTNQTIYLTMTTAVPYINMLDSFCSKFYWKRTA